MSPAISQTIINGIATPYKNDTLKLYTLSDFITQEPVLLAKSYVNDSGFFSFQINIEKPQDVYIDLPTIETHLIACPNTTYDIRLPVDSPSVRFKLFPLDEKEYVPAYIVSGDSGLNKEILLLQNYYSNLEKHLLFITNLKKRKSLYDSLIQTPDTINCNYCSNFFDNYKKYLNAGVHFDLFRYKPDYYLKNYFIKTGVLYNVRSYTDFFTKFFDIYLIKNECIDFDSLFIEINKGNFDNIKGIFAHCTENLDSVTLNVVTMFNLYNIFYKEPKLQNAIISVFSNLRYNKKISEIEIEIATNIYKKLTALRPGYKAPNFVLTNKNGKKIDLKDFEGDFVYLNVYSPYCKGCENYMLVLKRYREMKIKKLKIVTVFVGDSIDQMNEFLEKHNDYKWKFLFVPYSSNFIKKYKVTNFPRFYLIDPDGFIAVQDCPSPLDDFEQVYNQAYSYWKDRKKQENLLENQ